MEKILDSAIRLPLPNQFVIMPDRIKNIKYPSKNAPSLDILSILLKDGEIKDISSQLQNALKNVYPSIIIKNQVDTNQIKEKI